MNTKKIVRKSAKASSQVRAKKKPAPVRAKTTAKSKTVTANPSKTVVSPAAQPATGRDQWWRTFSQAVVVLMRDVQFKDMKLADLEQLVMPPVIAGQCRVAYARVQPSGSKPGATSVMAPVAVALWARVSPELDRLLTENLDSQLTLSRTDWSSGDNIWLTLAAGDKKFVPELLKNLMETVLKGRTVKARSRQVDGRTTIKVLAKPG